MFQTQDLAVIGLLIFLEGILSIDNAIAMALIARPLPAQQRKRALTYGLIGAVFFRLAAVGSATFLIHWRWLKFAGALYLSWIAGRHLISKPQRLDPSEGNTSSNVNLKRGFWKTVILIELTDIAFAIDSILAAVALSKKVWLVFTGGFIGVILIRFAAVFFIQLLDRFPRFETSAYLLVLLIGVKLLIDGFQLHGVEFDSPQNLAFWIFWILMLSVILYGFKPRTKSDTTPRPGEPS